MRLVEDDEGVVQRAAAHVGQRRDFDGAALGVLLDFFGGQHVVQRIVQRAEVRRDFFVKVAGQKAKRLAGFNGRAGEDDPRNLSLAQRRQCHGHCQIGFARAGRPDPKRDVVPANRVEIFFLADGFGGDAGLALVRQHAVAHQLLERRSALVLDDVQGVGELAIAHLGAALEHAFQRHKKLLGALDGLGGAFEFDPAFARGGLDAELFFERFKVARLVIEKLLRDARVFEMKGFSGHSWDYFFRPGSRRFNF